MDESQQPLNGGTVTKDDVESHDESSVESHVESHIESPAESPVESPVESHDESHDESEVENNVEINEPTSAPSIDSPYDPAYEIRRRRIFDHRAEAQAATNPLAACLAGANSDLFDAELELGEMIRQTLAANGLSVDNFEQLSKQFNLLLRYIKQISQTTQIELRLRKEDAEATATGSSGSP